MNPDETNAPSDRQTLARNLRALRGFAGISAKELAERSGIPLATIQSIESGRRPLSPLQVALIANATGADPRAFIRGELREWDGENPYDASSLNHWLAKGQYRQQKEWRSDLFEFQSAQQKESSSFSRDEIRLYVFFLKATFEMEQTEAAFDSVTSGISYWKSSKSPL